MIFPTDDYGYFAHATAMVFGQFPSYKKEIFFGQNSPIESIGPALLSMPFVFVFSLIDRLLGAPILLQRTAETIRHSWTLFGFVFASSFYFYLGCLLLYRGLRRDFEERHATLAVILMALCQGLPIFVYRRPVFSPSFEFFIQSVFVYLLLKYVLKKPVALLRPATVALIGVLTAFMFLVRFNNLFAAIMWPFVLLVRNFKDLISKRFYLRLALVFLIAGILVALFKILPEMYAPNPGYFEAAELLQHIQAPSFYFNRLVHILFGIDWGLIYTGPFLLIGLGSLFFLKFPLKRRLLLALAPMALNLYFVILWRTQGGSYGYRYFIVSVIPLLVYPLALLLRNSEKKYGKKYILVFAWIALLPLLSMLCYEGNMSNLRFGSAKQYFGINAPGNDTYQMEIWETLLFSPQHLGYTVFRGGLFYFIHLLAALTGTADRLPAMIYLLYPAFHGQVLIKALLIYALPVVLMLFFERFRPKSNRDTNENPAK